jgi:glycosyltransferase involved in cell wall biosynthesis
MSATVLIVVNHAGFFLSHRLPVALAAREAGYDVHVATPRSKHVPKIIDAGLTWHPITLSRSGRNPFRELVTIMDLYRLYRALHPDLVHHVTSKPVLYGTPIARFLRVHAVVNAISGMGHVFAGGNAVARTFRSLVSMTYRISLRHPRMRVIVQNSDNLKDFLEQGWARAEDCVVIPGSGVDTDVFVPHEHTVEVPRVVFASRLLYTKGVGDFVEAARLVNQREAIARFILVGEPDPDNPASVPLSELRRWHEEGVVEYAGRSEDMPTVLGRADIFCLPTFYGEGIPKVLVEAAAAGLAIIATDWPGCREVIQHDKTGILVPPHSPGLIAEAVMRLAADPHLRRTLGVSARERAVAKYSLQLVLRRSIEVYSELLA